MLRPSFSVGRYLSGYDIAQVDAFVERVQATVERRPGQVPVTVDDIRSAQFDRTMLRPGYDVAQVDQYLADAESWLGPHQQPQQGSPSSQSQLQQQWPGGTSPGAVSVPGGYRSPRFALVRFRDAYDPAEVDDFLGRVAATLAGRPDGQPVTAEDVRGQHFSSVRLREGYDVGEVDAYLDEIERLLR